MSGKLDLSLVYIYIVTFSLVLRAYFDVNSGQVRGADSEADVQ